jgi:hypothetical protein
MNAARLRHRDLFLEERREDDGGRSAVLETFQHVEIGGRGDAPTMNGWFSVNPTRVV